MLYEIALFTHFLGMIGLFGGFILYHRAMARLRTASTVGEARSWADLLATTSPMLGGGLGILVLSGLGLGYLRWEGTFPFTAVGLGAVVVIGILTGSSAGRWVNRIRQSLGEAESGDRPLPHDLAEEIADPGPWINTAIANGLSLGIVWGMTTKPGWGLAIGIVAGAGVAGGVIGAIAARQESGTESAGSAEAS